jgi:signal transduction histidine kinase/ligand-binding sensor domain-containing protein/DNA-binding response OmpR family regulator
MKGIKRETFLILILVVTMAGLQAQPSVITSLGREQGLSNNYVVSITQDKDGFLWFATEEGLNKFDGTRFTSYYKHTGNISGNELNYIYADPVEPVIWIATQRAGLDAYNYEHNTLEVFTHNDESPSSLITNDITSITPAADGNLWISTYYRGVEYFNKRTKEFTHYNTETLPDLVSDMVWTILDDHNGNLYIGHVQHGMSVLSLNDGQVVNFRNNPSDKESIPGNEVRCIYKDPNNNIWVGTDKGLALFNSDAGKFISVDSSSQGILTSRIFDIRQMNDHKLWVATELNGIAVIDIKQHFFMPSGQPSIQHYMAGHNKYSLSVATVRSIFQDSFGNIWLATYGGGINFIGHTQPLFESYGYSPLPDDVNSLNNRIALSLCLDNDEKLWIGTDGSGVNVFENGQRIRIYNKERGTLTHNTIQTMMKDSRGNIWLGSFLTGIDFYDHQSKRFQPIVVNGGRNWDVRCFFEDADANIWVGTQEGIWVLDGKTRRMIHHYDTKNNQLPEDQVRAINQDHLGRMWIGTFGLGLAVYTKDMQLLADFNEYNNFCSNTINQIFRDSYGEIWIATGEGLVRFAEHDSFHYEVFQRDNGLHNTNIRAITEDGAGNIWFSSNDGITCYVREKKQFYNYNLLDKSPMGSFSSGAVTKDKKGSIYFGYNKGVCYFNPAFVLEERIVPQVVITDMKIYESGVAPKNDQHINSFVEKNRHIVLNHKQNTFSISFNIQDYSLTNHVDYAYMLEGLDEVWHTVNDNTVMFRNVPPGRYKFLVNTRIRNQEWSPESIYPLSIHIQPPLWLTWWAKTLYVAAGLLIVFFFLLAYKKRLEMQSSYELEKNNREQEQELNNERLRFYTNIAHELRTPLTLILGPLEDLQKDAQLLSRQQQKISIVRQSALQLLNLINQILEFRKAETQNRKLCVSKSNLAVLVKEAGLKYMELNVKQNIQFEINIEGEEMFLYFDKEIVNIILDNLISNAMKYTDKGLIRISLYTTMRNNLSYTEIKVEDTGYGISKEDQTRIFDRYYQAKGTRQVPGTGIGLALVKNLADLHEGEIRVESKIDEGSSFYFSLLTHNIYPNALHNDREEETTESAESINESAEETKSNGKPILLVVEDNPEIREYILDSLSDSFHVITAGEGEEGCNAAFTHIPDIIVSDIMMPGMDGITFCEKIKADVRTSHIPVILLTAKDSIQDKEEGYRSGADSYLTKPFSASLLHSRINNLLETRKRLATQFVLDSGKDEKSALFKESLNKLDNEFLENLTRLIEENIQSEKVDISYLSGKLFMSNSTLYRKVKALTGISTNEFVRKVKMNNAERLLLTGKYNISEVSFRVGMSSPVYFRQCFKEEFGLSPSEYLKKIKTE